MSLMGRTCRRRAPFGCYCRRWRAIRRLGNPSSSWRTQCWAVTWVAWSPPCRGAFHLLAFSTSSPSSPPPPRLLHLLIFSTPLSCSPPSPSSLPPPRVLHLFAVLSPSSSRSPPCRGALHPVVVLSTPSRCSQPLAVLSTSSRSPPRRRPLHLLLVFSTPALCFSCRCRVLHVVVMAPSLVFSMSLSLVFSM
jgi:hypothetical protein